MAYTLADIAMFYWSSGRLDQAEEYYERADKLLEKLPVTGRDSSCASCVLSNKGTLLMNRASELDSDPFTYNTATDGPSFDYLYGIEIDLDDFAVAPLASVTDLNFPKPIPNGVAIDVMLLAGKSCWQNEAWIA